MKQRDLILFLGLQIFALLWAGLLFSLLPSKILAGALAGAYFLGSGIFMLGRTRFWPDMWRNPIVYILLIHIFVISIPMLVFRLYQYDQPFESVQIFGVPGPTFHQISNIVFATLILLTVVEYIKQKSQSPTRRKDDRSA